MTVDLKLVIYAGSSKFQCKIMPLWMKENIMQISIKHCIEYISVVWQTTSFKTFSKKTK